MPTIFHIPVCPFSQRVEVLLALKGRRDAVDFHVVDITKPRPDWLVAKTGEKVPLPIAETDDGTVLRESMVLLQYFDDLFPEVRIAQRDPLRRAVENMLATKERDFVSAGYRFVMNPDRSRRDALHEHMLGLYAGLDAFLAKYAPDRTFLFEEFGWAEAVFTPIFMRFWFLEYYEGFELPGEARFARVRKWRDACLAHPAAQQVSREEIVKVYYDYAKNVGNGALVPGRSVSSFVFEPHWRSRPWPPRDKYDRSATDAELGLVR